MQHIKTPTTTRQIQHEEKYPEYFNKKNSMSTQNLKGLSTCCSK